MGYNFEGKLKIGNKNEYLIPTLMEYFNGKTITHIETGWKFAVIATKIEKILFSKEIKGRKSFQDVIIICKN